MSEEYVGSHCRKKHLSGIVCMLKKGHEGYHTFELVWSDPDD